jgi:hypothetical protein
VVLEALVGQVFLVTLVARLVALFGSEQKRTEAHVVRDRPRTPDERDP